MTRGLRVSVHATSDVGLVRERNEDSYFTGVTAFAVADGMGGHQAGEVASRTALEPVAELDGQMFASAEDAQEALVDAIAAANAAVVAEGDADPGLAGMGTTLTATVVRDGRAHLAHVGDSRAYLLRPGHTLSQLTTDHTLVEQLVREGRLSRDEAANHPQRSVVTRAIGVEREVQVDSLPPIELQPGDQILLCSDGLTGPVDDEDIARLLDDEDGDEACRALVAAANDAGGPDNITVVLLRVSGSRRKAAAAAAAGADTTTEALEPTEPHPEAPRREGPTTQIRTRAEPAGTSDWAERMGHFGKPQGADGSGPRMRRREGAGRGARLAAIAVGIVLLLGLVGGGGYALLSRAFFVGDLDGEVVIFNGIPQSVGTVPLHWIREGGSGVRTDDLPPFQAERIRAGEITAGSLVEAREIIERYRDQAEQARPDPTPAPTLPDDPDTTTDNPDTTTDNPDTTTDNPDTTTGHADADEAATP